MPISPVNLNKNISTFSGGRKAGVYSWGDVLATWGDAIAPWGTSYSVTNVNKNIPASITTVIGSPIGLLLALTHATATTTGTGWTNINKN